MTRSDMIHPPRFRTLQDAGKYIMAQMYPDAREVPATHWGAVQVGTPLKDAPFFVTWRSMNTFQYNGMVGIDYDMEERMEIISIIATDEMVFTHTEFKMPHQMLNLPPPVKTLTSAMWLQEKPYDNFIILMPNGWDDIENFYDFFNHTKITEDEFNRRLGQSILETR